MQYLLAVLVVLIGLLAIKVLFSILGGIVRTVVLCILVVVVVGLVQYLVGM